MKKCRHNLKSFWGTLRYMPLPWGFLYCYVCGYVPTDQETARIEGKGELGIKESYETRK